MNIVNDRISRQIRIYLSLWAIIAPLIIFAGTTSFNRNIKWKPFVNLSGQKAMLRFEGSINDMDQNFLPVFFENFKLDYEPSDFTVELKSKIFEPLTSEENLYLQNFNTIGNEIKIDHQVSFSQKVPFASISFIPIRKNEITGQYERLVKFNLIIVTDDSQGNQKNYTAKSYKNNSVLASGNWYKIAVNNTGIQQLSYQNLVDMGIDVGSINPKDIRLYGTTAGMLPENISKFRYDDLAEIAIFVNGENDNSFDPGDYLLFYGQSANVWKYDGNTKLLKKSLNLYADQNFYFLTTDLGPGKRISTQTSSNETPNNMVYTYDDAIHYEMETKNLLNSGRVWYGETFDLSNNLLKDFEIPKLDLNSRIILSVKVAAHSDAVSYFNFRVNGNEKIHLPVPKINSTDPNGDYAQDVSDSAHFISGSNKLNIEIIYTKPLSTSVGFLDYFSLNFRQDLAFGDGQTAFRDLKTASNELVSKYNLSKSNANVMVWNVSQPFNVKQLVTTLSGTVTNFTLASDSLQEFIAFDGTQYYYPTFAEKINNQNLHALSGFDMLIITHPAFREEAERLATFHRDYDNLEVEVVEPKEIYNEFSSGAQDITAIRDFIKMIYDKSEGPHSLKYLLLFGDGSFDYKDRVDNNTNFIPCWESAESINPVSSYVKDDFYGLLDDSFDNMVDLGIGRFVVSNELQAKQAVDKVIHYATKTPIVMGDWRNIICLIGDDEDGNLHFGDAEELAELIDTTNRNLNIEKIYLDAYQQVSTPSGERYPDVTLDINNRVNRGALIVNYVGHGGEGGLAHERIMTITDINSWNNYDNPPVFITATCEFSRFDDPERTSAGEYIFLQPDGGGVALFTTTRATYAGANSALNKNFYLEALIRESDGHYPRMGDIIRVAKNNSGSIQNTAKFMLLGDPALRIAFPEHRVLTATINGINIEDDFDTIQALSKVTITGDMEDVWGNKLTNFNGILYPTVFDKPAKITTLGNDENSIPAEFLYQKNALYKGKASIVDGSWTFTFIAPKDLAYQYGYGKISYYAHNETEDANGYFDEIVVGGYNPNAPQDNQGPTVKLFINDSSFVAGGLTDENPHLMAYIFDESGINTVGSGIGHDILATIDEQDNFVLNNYYEAELDDYQKGSIMYPFYNLTNGQHSLTIKVWDIHNNSTLAKTWFIVAGSLEMSLESLFNYPNPFRDYTTFSFEHNQVEQPLDISIQIFALNGQHVKTISDIYYAGGYRYKSAPWNGISKEGRKLDAGMYIYKLLVRNYDGTVAQESNKLVIIH